MYKDRYCHWFDNPKIIPQSIIEKGCKYRLPLQNKISTTKTVEHIIDIFNGELI